MAYSKLLLFQRILWATETATCVCIHESIHLLNSMDLAIDLPSEEASVSCELLCVLWATVH